MSGKFINFLGTFGCVTNPEDCIEGIKRLAQIDEVDLKYINSYASSVQGAVRYFDAKLVELFDEFKERDAKYMWVDTGYKCNRYSIYASFYKTPLGWAGAYVGTEGKLRYKIQGYTNRVTSLTFNNNTIIEKDIELSEEECRNLNKNQFCIELYKKLLIKEHWAKSKKGSNRLAKYLEALMAKVQHNMKKSIVQGYILSKDNSKVVINTNLIDKFMNDIYVCFEKQGEQYVNPIIVENKIDLVRMGFDREQIKNMPKPIKFYDKPEELVFSGTIEDFDIGDSKRLHHVINERRNRFPEKFAQMSQDVLCEKLKAAVEKAVKLAAHDYKYVVPMYNTAMDTIQFLMPLHLERSIEESPELVLVISNIEGFYSIMTILTPDDAYDNARVIARPGNSWLQPD